MKKHRRIVSALLAGVLCVCLLPASELRVEASGQNSKLTPLARYNSTVKLTVGRENNAGGNFAPGESAFNNGLTKLLKEKLNIEIVNKKPLLHPTGDSFNVIGTEYNVQLALRIASKTLPDTFFIQDNPAGRQMFEMLVEGNMLADLTEIYNKAVGGETKKALEGVNKTELLKYMTVDGKLYGVTGGNEALNFPYMWIRKDWLDKLGLKIPKTIAEIEKVALAFIDKKPGGNPNTTGIAIAPQPEALYGQWLGATPIFYSFNSFPDQWIEKNGTIVHGAIQPETKQALTVLANWYKKGIIPKDFATMKNGDEMRDAYVGTNGCGIIFSAWWQPWPNWDGAGDASANKDASIEWVPVLAPVNANGNYSAMEDIYRPSGQVVNIRCKDPEAVIKGMNLIAEHMNYYGYKKDADAEAILSPMIANSDSRTCNPFVGGLAPPNNRLDALKAINDYIATGKVSDVFASNSEVQGAYKYATDNGLKAWYAIKGEPTDEQKADAMQRYVGQYGYVMAGSLLAEKGALKLYYPAFKGSTESDSEYMALLKEMVETTFNQIITGQKSIDDFDTFVTQWKGAGGDILTKEVNEAMGKK